MKNAPEKRILLPLSFLLPAGLMAVVFALCGLAPFGTRTMGVMDMAHQYLPFLYSLRDILAGRTSLLYLPGMALGGNMLGAAAYYLTSPLNLLCCLFPREAMYTAVSLVYFVRVGLCGLTMCVYAGRRHGYVWRCLVPALAYAFTAYMVGYCFNYLWQDCVILLPLLALGLWRLAAERRPWLYVVTLAAALLLSFYIGYILCVFSVLFFVYELLSIPPEKREKPWRTVGVFALSSLAAGALAAVLLAPTACALSGGKAAFSLSVLTLTPQFDLRDLLAKFYVGAFRYEEIMPDGLPQVFCGTVTGALALLYLTDGRIPRRRRLLTGLFGLALLLSFWITALDLFWHALNRPHWYNYRYSFLLCFLLAAAAERELGQEGAEPHPARLWLPAAVCAAASALVFVGRSYAFASWKNALAAFAITAAACALVWLARRPQAEKKRLAAGLFAGLLVLHAGDLAANAKLSLAALTIPASDSAAYASYVTEKEEAFALIDTGSELQRVESPVCFRQDHCEPLLFGYDGISYYGSTVATENFAFLQRLGVTTYENVWAAYGPGVTAAADSLLGIRYIVSAALDKSYPALAATDAYTVWENPNALPAAWTADAALAGELPGEDCFAYMNAFFAAAAPEIGGGVFTPAPAAVETENLRQENGVYRLQDPAAAGVLRFALTAPADGALYAALGFADLPSVFASVNGRIVGQYGTPEANGSLFLGSFAAGETVTLELETYADLALTYAAFATADDEALAAYAAALREGGCPLEKRSGAHYTGAFTTGAGDALLVLTLPYDAGWTVTLDGARAEPVKVQDCLMALSVTPGTHTVELRYCPPGLIPGAAITALALAACLAVRLRSRKRRT